MQFDLERVDQGEAFRFFASRIREDGGVDYDPPDADAAVFILRPMGPKVEALQADRKRKVEHVLNPQTRAMERLVYLEELPPDEARRQRDDIWDYVIVGWEGALDGSGQPIPVTRENKLKLMRMAVFDRFVSRCLQLMASAGAQAQEAAEKN